MDLTFEVGAVVDVKGHGRATVVELPPSDPGHQYHGRYKVLYSGGGTYYCNPSRLRRLRPTKKRLLVCSTTREYRAAAIQNTDREDSVLEVGCHEGETTARIHSRSSLAVGIDKSAITVETARRRHPHVRFEVVDAFDVAALRGLAPTKGFNKIFVDIGGIAELPTVMALVGTYFREFKHAVLVVKSVFLARLLTQAEVFRCQGDWAAAEPGTEEEAAEEERHEGGEGSHQANGDSELGACNEHALLKRTESGDVGEGGQ